MNNPPHRPINWPVWRFLWLLLVVIMLAAIYWIMERTGALSLLGNSEQLQLFIKRLGIWGPAAIILCMALAIVLNPIPSAPIALAAGAAYGHIWGTLYVVAGAELGALVAFFLARTLGYTMISRIFGDQIRLGWLGSQNMLTVTVFTTRLIPFLSFDLVSYGAGITPIKTWRFALATLFGILPASFLLAHFGGNMTTDNADQLLYTILLLGLLLLIPILSRIIYSRFKP